MSDTIYQWLLKVGARKFSQNLAVSAIPEMAETSTAAWTDILPWLEERPVTSLAIGENGCRQSNYSVSESQHLE